MSLPKPDGEIGALLAQTFEDRRMSRNERRRIGGAVEEGADRSEILRAAFAFARTTAANDPALVPEILDWLEEAARATREEIATGGGAGAGLAEAHFSPGDECLGAIRRFILGARRTLDVCVFTITDDRLSEALIESRDRGVSVRILTDNEKAEDLGSDIDELRRRGFPVRVDQTPFHMHHKFALADGTRLLTGSYNWTRGAARDNQENLIVADDPRLVAPFARAFERLWERLETPARRDHSAHA